MEEQNNLEQQEIEQQEVEEPARREFVSKLVTTAGAVALAGLLSGGKSEAAEVPAAAGTLQMHKFSAIKLRNGFRMSLSGKEIGTALQQAGLLREGVNLDNAAITIEFTA